jgi:hypothetical protein
LKKWNEFQRPQIRKIIECQRLIKRQKAKLDEQEGEEQAKTMFEEAILRSCEPTENHAAVLAKLLKARKNYAVQLKVSTEECQAQYQELVQEMEEER